MAKISLDEFASNVILGACLLSEPCDSETAQAIADTVPDAAVPLVLLEIEKILAPDYRYILHIGGPGPSPEVREQLRSRYETRMIEAALAIKAALKSRPT